MNSYSFKIVRKTFLGTRVSETIEVQAHTTERAWYKIMRDLGYLVEMSDLISVTFLRFNHTVEA